MLDEGDSLLAKGQGFDEDMAKLFKIFSVCHPPSLLLFARREGERERDKLLITGNREE